MTRTQKFLATLALVLGVSAAAAGPAPADNSMPSPPPYGGVSQAAPAGQAP
ncbi:MULTISPECIES: hypothetical protein [Streptomyces]|uniref:hypothetical protein n=1 Tax=Streptomyces TaxID=1883 RepID=UPI00165ED686|nr:hypothetical protein [Streptomyces apricus]